MLTPESVKLPLIVSSKGDENSYTPVTLIFVIETSKGNSSLLTFGKFNSILTNSFKFGISNVTTEFETTSIDFNSVLFTLISVQDSEVIFSILTCPPIVIELTLSLSIVDASV